MVQIVLTLNAFLDVMSSGGHWYSVPMYSVPLVHSAMCNSTFDSWCCFGIIESLCLCNTKQLLTFNIFHLSIGGPPAGNMIQSSAN